MISITNNKSNCKVKIYGKIAKIYKNLIKEVVATTIYKERINNPKIEIEVMICNLKEMIEHNEKLLKKEGPTDVISISFEEDPKNKTVSLLGTILICPRIIKADGEELRKNYTKHLTHLLVHSTLHLLGYNHENREDQIKMESKEINILSFLGIESPYLDA